MPNNKSTRPAFTSLPAGFSSCSPAKWQPQRRHCCAEGFNILPRFGLNLMPPRRAHIIALGAIIEPVRK
jgi:hypothetical protein